MKMDMEDISQDSSYASKREVLRVAQLAEADSILMIGQTGGGKSSIANAIMGINRNETKLFPEGSSLKSETSDISIHEGRWFGIGEKVTVIDTPGFFDTEGRTQQFLVALMDFITEFPKDRLRLLIVTLPLVEQRANSSYADMLYQIDGFFQPSAHQGSIWPHVVFVTTCANKLHPSIDINPKISEWKDWLEARGVEDPIQMVNFDYNNPTSLSEVKTIFDMRTAYTPMSTTEMREFLMTNPGADIETRMKQSKAMQETLDKTLQQLDETKKKCKDTLKRLQSMETLTRMQERSLKEATEKHKQLEEQVTALRNRPPTIHYVSSGSRGGCVIS